MPSVAAPNVHEHIGRQAKAEKLAAELVASIEQTEIATDVTFTPTQVVELASKLSDEAWAKLSVDADVNEPSTATRAVAVQLAAHVILRRNEAADPWAGIEGHSR